MKLSELTGALAGVEETLIKVQTEVQALKDSLADVEIPAEAQASLDRLTTLATALDALNEDTLPPTP